MKMHEETVVTTEVVELVDKALNLDPSFKAGKADLVAAAHTVLFGLRVALEDAGAEDPIAVMVAAVNRYQQSLARRSG